MHEAERQRLRGEIHELRLQMAQPEPGEVHVEKVLQVTRYIGKLEDDVAAFTRKLAQLEQQKQTSVTSVSGSATQAGSSGKPQG